jgi:hypothetical protein
MGLFAAATPPADADSPASVLTLGRGAISPPVPAGFLGVSTELFALENATGYDAHAINPVFVQLIRNLAPGQRPVLRLGGDSTDWSWWPIPGMARPPDVWYALSPHWTRIARALAATLHARLIVGINLATGSPHVAATEARQILRRIGRRWVEAVELGNEPELYGFVAPGPPSGYDFPGYIRLFSSVAGSLPPVMLAAPAFGAPDWLRLVPPFLADEPRVGLLTLHRYPLENCHYLNDATVADLLSSYAAGGLADGVAPYVGIAHARGMRIRIDELNSISCGGQPGLSNSFASALWMLDTLFQMARVGVDGVNIHTRPGTYNKLFSFWRFRGRWEAFVHPDYYGALMFAEATPPGSRLLRVTGGASPALHVWATRARDGRVRLVLINEHLDDAQVVLLRGTWAGRRGTLELLRAPNITARSGVTLGGQSFGRKTRTGLLGGIPRMFSVERRSGGYFLVKLPPVTAALLTLYGP